MFDHIEHEADEAPASPVSPVTTCHAPGCTGATTGGKPVCIDHLEALPSVRRLMARWEKVAVYSEDGRCVVGESDLGTPAPGERPDLVKLPVTPRRGQEAERAKARAERRESVVQALEELGEGRHTPTAIAERSGYVLAVVGQELRGLAAQGRVTSYAGQWRLAHVPA